jgi:alanine racemase
VEEEYYRTRVYIDKTALRHNIRLIRQTIGDSVWMLGVVKANAYGHGFRNIVPVLEEEGVKYLAVATVEEGIELRKEACRLPILLLGYTDPAQYEQVLSNDLTVALFHEADAKCLSDLALRRGTKAKAHIKMDTGMGRIGLPCSPEGYAEAVRIAALPGLSVEGAFTHLARADEKNKSITDQQVARYQAFLMAMEKAGVSIPLQHISNSAAIMEYPLARQNGEGQHYQWMVRAGIMLYGLYPSHEMDRERMELWPVLSWMSHVVHLKTVPAGTPIGYGGTYVASEERRIATIPVGYGDGYPRRLSNTGHVVIEGKRAPITGRVCMDQIMVDVTDIPEVRLGSPVTLIGEGITAEEIADQIGTIHYEVVCQITGRVPRVCIGQ